MTRAFPIAMAPPGTVLVDELGAKFVLLPVAAGLAKALAPRDGLFRRAATASSLASVAGALVGAFGVLLAGRIQAMVVSPTVRPFFLGFAIGAQRPSDEYVAGGSATTHWKQQRPPNRAVPHLIEG